MTWPLCILVALLAGGLGLLAGGLVMSACVGWYRISSFEGKSGYAIVTIALLSAIAAFVVGLVIAWVAPGFLVGLAVACGTVLALAGVAAAVARGLADVPPRIDGQELMLEIEMRLPAGATLSPELELHSVVRRFARRTRRGEFRVLEARSEGGRSIVPGSVFLFTGRGMRTISYRIDDRPWSGFQVPLPARPRRAHEGWSEWGPRPRPPKPPWPDTEPSFRFRVRRVDE